MYLCNLILDVKVVIGSFDQETWIKLMLYDKEFKQYAYGKIGINKFVEYFYIVKDGIRYLFNKKHSIHDIPSQILYGNQYWYCSDKIHRENDLPAIIYSNGNKYWYCYGNFHRNNDLPAIILASGGKEWYCNGKPHRENDLPAVILASGDKFWYYDGKIHRDNNLPAIIRISGVKCWYRHGEYIKSDY